MMFCFFRYLRSLWCVSTLSGLPSSEVRDISLLGREASAGFEAGPGVAPGTGQAGSMAYLAY